jgi:hypothetical protein
MKNLEKNHNHGSALVLIIITMVVLMLTGVGLLAVGYNSRVFAIRDSLGISARSAADAGLSRVVYEINKMIVNATLGDTINQSFNEQVQPFAQTNQNFSTTITGSWIGSNAPAYSIVSNGYCGSAQKIVYASLAATGLYENAIFVSNEINMGNNDIVIANVAGTPVNVGTLSAADDAINLGNGTIINGNAFVGPGGNPADGISGGTVNGTKFVLDEPIPMPVVGVPSAAASASPNIALILDADSSIGTTGTTTYCRYSSITLNKSGTTLNIRGNVVMYVPGDITMYKQGMGINVTANSSLSLYIGGDFKGQNGLGLSNATNDPSKLKIYGVNPTYQALGMKNNGTICACIYAPNADVESKNSGNFTGSVSARNFTMKNNGTFYYDPRVRNYSKSEAGVRLVVTNWRE